MITDLALHAEPMAEPADGMRWVLPDVRLPVGRLLRAPGELGALLVEGPLEEAWCEPHALQVRLRPQGSWRQCGDAVRTAVRTAVADLDQWHTDGDRDTTLRSIVADVLAGPVGEYITSHGGLVDIQEVAQDSVTLGFGGACGHCPASGSTLHDRLEVALRERYPDLREVRAGDADQCRPKLLLWPRRRP